MKKLLAIGLAVSMLAMAGTAMAENTATVDVSATVAGACKFINGGVVSFALDPSTGGNVNANVTTYPKFGCTKGTVYTIKDDKGLNGGGTTYNLIKGPGELIEYTLTYTSGGTGTGFGTLTTLDLGGQVLQAAYIDMPAGSYTDKVTLTITP